MQRAASCTAAASTGAGTLKDPPLTAAPAAASPSRAGFKIKIDNSRREVGSAPAGAIVAIAASMGKKTASSGRPPFSASADKAQVDR
jgi:hypothetical protein